MEGLRFLAHAHYRADHDPDFVATFCVGESIVADLRQRHSDVGACAVTDFWRPRRRSALSPRVDHGAPGGFESRASP